jgi:DNA-directed RNA polymerase subunit F
MFGAPQFGDESYFEATADEAQEWINKWDGERLSERAALFAKRADDDAREAKEELERVQAARHRLAVRLAELTGSTPEQSKEILELLEGIQ